MIRALVGQVAIMYALHVPGHRGKWRLLHTIDSILGPFDLTTPHDRIVLRVFSSSSMDVSYFRRDSAQSDQLVVSTAIRRLRPGGVFVDVGANCGFLAAVASRAVGPDGLVVAIEPSAREFVRLLATIERNQLTNTVGVRAALSDANGIAQLEIAASHTGLNRMVQQTGCKVKGAVEHVAAHTGDAALMAWTSQRPVSLVKIDVEGAELMVLRGMRQWLKTAQPEAVLIEVTPRWLEERGGSKGELYNIMKDSGYVPTVCADTWQYDELFVRREVADR